MMNGASVLEGYVPELDATVVTRILDAGGIIAGKTVCEYLCTSGGSHTSATGPVRNPHKPTHTTGGSSSGSAAAVAAGDVDLALGCDQAGSVRQPGRPLRHLCDEGNLRAGALYRHHGGRGDGRPLRPHDRRRGRQRAAARGDRRGRRARSAPARGTHRALHEGAGRGGPGPQGSRGEGGLRAGQRRGRRQPAGPRRRPQAGAARHAGRGGVDPLAPAGPADLVADRQRGAGAQRAVDERHAGQLQWPADGVGRRRVLALAQRGRRSRRHLQGDRHVRQPCAACRRRPLLRQGAEPGAPPARRLRRGAGRIRPAADADDAAQGPADPRARGGPARDRRIRFPLHRQLLLLQPHRPPGDVAALRQGRGHPGGE